MRKIETKRCEELNMFRLLILYSMNMIRVSVSVSVVLRYHRGFVGIWGCLGASIPN